MRAALLGFLFLASLLAGCASQPAAVEQASTPAPAAAGHASLSLDKALELAIPVTDGVVLHGTVYVPKVPDATKVPVLMDMGPYYGNLGPDTQVDNGATSPTGLYTHFLQRGYAIALVSVRGTGQSGGCFKVGGAQERADVAATIEWLARQAWSDGNVAMTGVSYDGSTPWEGLVSRAPHLKAVIPVEGISDFYRYSFFEGVPVNTGPLFNTYYKALVDVAYKEPGGAPGWGAAQSSAACTDQSDVFASPYQTYADGVHGPYWDERDATALLGNATAATYVVHGFQDYNVRLDDVQELWPVLPEHKRMLLGQWEHNIPWHDTFNPKFSFADYNQTVDDWLDAYLRNDTAAQARLAAAAPVLMQDSTGAWWNLTAWPPTQTTESKAFLTAKGALASEPGAAGSATLQANTVADVAAGFGAPVPTADVVFRSEPATNATRLFGNPWANLTVSADQPRGMVALALYDEGPDGSLFFLSEGFQNLATRTDRHHAEDVPTGVQLTLHVKMYAMAQVLDTGHRLRLVVSAAHQDATLPSAQAGSLTLLLGGEKAPYLALPVFSG